MALAYIVLMRLLANLFSRNFLEDIVIAYPAMKKGGSDDGKNLRRQAFVLPPCGTLQRKCGIRKILRIRCRDFLVCYHTIYTTELKPDRQDTILVVSGRILEVGRADIMPKMNQRVLFINREFMMCCDAALTKEVLFEVLDR